jgi:hypothetical protein
MLKDKRKEIIEYVKKHRPFIKRNCEALDIYEGNLLPYVDQIMQRTLSENYYNTIKDRIVPINIIQRYIDKVSTAYETSPIRTSESAIAQEFVDFYANKLDMSVSGQIADQYSNLSKGFAWEPYVNNKGEPAIRELSFDKFLVMSDSQTTPEEETIFIKFMGYKSTDENSLLLFVYTDLEFDAFYMNEEEASQYLVENQGLNPVGVIPFVYGKRQKNKLIPTQDSDMLSIGKTLSVMLSDAAGAQFYQCFSLMYGIDVNNEGLVIAPNVFWNLKSDMDKKPEVGVIKPEADTQKVLDFVMNVFVLWLETKGIRVGSMGSLSNANLASGVSKIIDEMDVYSVRRKSMQWFEKDEMELWNEKLPMIHNYWIQSGLIDPKTVPPLVNEAMEVVVKFDEIEPLTSRVEDIANVKSELEIKTITLKQAIIKLHPEYTEEEVQEVLNDAVEKEVMINGMDENQG